VISLSDDMSRDSVVERLVAANVLTFSRLTRRRLPKHNYARIPHQMRDRLGTFLSLDKASKVNARVSMDHATCFHSSQAEIALPDTLPPE